MKNTITILALIFAATINAQTITKKIIATYDSTVVGFKEEAYFTTVKDKKNMAFHEDGYDQDRNPKDLKEFWNSKNIKTYSKEGIQFVNHTNLNNVGKKYEIEYTVQEMPGEEGSFFLISIISFKTL